MAKVVLAGDKVGSLSELRLGEGCYEVNGTIFASVGGFLSISDNKVVSVKSKTREIDPVPVVGDEVVCRVTKLTNQLCNVEILSVGDKLLRNKTYPFVGIVRKENVRSFDVDRVVMSESFRPGDIVRAKVVSLGSLRSFELSTADIEHGVVMAWHQRSKQKMVPVSWTQMKCPETELQEFRKVAKTTD